MLYVSRFGNKELQTGNYTAVRISMGYPKWNVGYEIAGEIKELMPFGLFGIEDKDEFKRRYFEKLNKPSMFEKVSKQLKKFQESGKDVVLLCYEDIRKGPNNWCHRTMFADWWLEQTGEKIPELKDDSKFKYEDGYNPEKEKPKVAPVVLMSLF